MNSKKLSKGGKGMLPGVKYIGHTKIDAGEVYLVDYCSNLKAMLLHHVTGAITILPLQPKSSGKKNRLSN